MQLIVARRPIYDRKKQVIGYHFSAPQKGDPTTTRALLQIAIDGLANGKLAFVDHEAGSDPPELAEFASDQFVLSITGSDADAVFSDARRYAELNIRVAVPQSLFERREADLVGIARYFVVDPNGKYDSVLASKAAAIKKLGIRMIGERVGDYPTFNKCVAMGFEYVSGSFICRPIVAGRRVVASSRLGLIQLMTRLQDPSVTVDEIERMISVDPNLGFRLLRLVNSASEGMRETVESLRSAILLVETIKIANLVSLLAYQKLDDKPDALTQLSMLRARASELVAIGLHLDRPERFFTAGLLSVLEAMFDVPMADLVEQLPLTTELADALTNLNSPDNEIALVLRNVLALEEARFDDLDERVLPVLEETYADALRWSDEAIGQ